MPSFSDTAISLYRRLFGTPETAARLADGIETVLDGDTAVAIAEACIADTAAIGSGGLAWLSEMDRSGRNMLGSPLGSLDAEGPRGALAAATGLAMAGQRATVFLENRELAATQDLLAAAANQRLPLVIHLNARGHEALHQAADSGCFILVASNIQQAVDYTFIARRVAELSLVPGMVVLDGEQAHSPQEVKLPSVELVRRFIGRGDETIDAPSEAQKLLFGEQRRRIPTRHNLDRPVLQGALHDGNSFAPSVAAGAHWFGKQVAELLQQSFTEFARLTGREYGALTAHDVEKADRVLIAMGGAVESAIAAADHLRRKEKIKVGVIGLHALRPFPLEQLTALLAGKRTVTVMARCDAPLASASPLQRELRAAVPNTPLQSVIYGLGGLPLRSADLLQLGRENTVNGRYLGIDFGSRDERYPKRQALLDTLRRHYPEIDGLGLRGEKGADLRPDESLSLAIHRLAGEESGLANEIGTLLHQLLGGQLRSHTADSWESWGTALCDRLHHAPANLRDPGTDAPADLLLLTTARLSTPALLESLTAKGIALLDGDVAALSAELQQAVQKQKLHLYTTAPTIPGERSEERRERLLGSLFGVLHAEGKLGEIKARRVRTAREETLGHLTRAQRDTLLNAFDHGLDAVQKIGNDLLSNAGAEARHDRGAPLAVRHLGDDDGSYTSLPRFQDQVGVLYRDGAADSLSADPYLALNSVPPLTALFRDHSAARQQLPRFDAANCTACGKCWANCPDSAIGATAIGPKALLETGIALAGVSGLRAISGKLATGIATLLRKDVNGSTAEQLLDAAWAWLEDKAPPAEDRREALAGELQQVKQALAGLPLSVTEPLFHKAPKDSGELLALAINPDSCKGCGLCAGLCEDNALEMADADAADTDVAQRLWSLWQQTPDSASATIERLMRDGFEPMAAQMLSRHCAFALAGGDGAEAGSGEKIALRQVLAATEYRQQPLLHRLIGELAELQKGLNAKIRDTLADALPSGDLDRLSSSLAKVHTREAALEELIGGNEQLEGSGVDAPHLRRLIELAKGVSQLHWRLSKGEHGLGRARYSLAFAPGSAAAWAGAFPWNPFHAPVVIEMTGNAPQVAAGLVQGQINETLATVQTLRRARAELDPRAAKPDNLPRWEELDDDERLLCPPLWLVGNDQSLGGEGFAQIAWLLNSSLPIKVLVLADLDLGLGSHGIADAALTARRDARSDLALMALAQRNAYVAQGSFAAPQHLNDAVRGMLRFPGPALLRVHAPSPSAHGFAATETLHQAELAVNSSVLPLFNYDPQADGVFGSRLSLEGNPQPRLLWAEGQTPAHWALGEQRFAPRLTALHGKAPAPTELTAWLALEPAQRSGKTPFISIGDERFVVDPALAATVEKLGHAWRTLQELAGLVTPFTTQVEAEAQQNLAAAHQAELDALRREYEEKLRALEAGMQGEMHDQITRRLMELAGYEN